MAPPSLGNLLGLVATFYFASALFIIFVLGTIARAGRLQHLQIPHLYQGRVADRARHVVVGKRAAAIDGQARERLGCSRSVVGLVVPTGYSFNLDGTNIYMTLATLFIAQALNIRLDLSSN